LRRRRKWTGARRDFRSNRAIDAGEDLARVFSGQDGSMLANLEGLVGK